MKKYLLSVILTSLGLFAQESIIAPKNCEVIKLSTYTTLVSCDKFDYLVEYQDVKRDDEDGVKKVTAISLKETKIIKGQ
ncbi:MAG: hypothetical protein ACNI3C_06065 [Candidatus Marinarcus sp.]|uniref:hypothetical protein n=1 Tax=Candidatus Marinarcus sp. TaxID=3100987 RepID=UPI003B00F91A